MMVMISNNSGTEVGYLAGRYPGRLGHLYSPGAQRGPYEFLRYGIDNRAYVCWKRKIEWPEQDWRALLTWAAKAKYPPLWALVPDVVASRDLTLWKWEKYAPVVREHGFRAAFAVQDGMEFSDVPDSDCMLFLGGTTGWKEKAIRPWCARFPGRVHVGRVTESKRLMTCYEAGAVSVDGNDWYRKTNKPGQRIQNDDLKSFLELTSQQRRAA